MAIGFMFSVLFIVCGRAYSAPALSGYSGATAHGSTVTLTGSSFGAKNSTIYIFDNMDSGAFNSQWNTVNQLTISNSSNRSGNSNYHGFLDFSGANVVGGEVKGYFTGGSNKSKWFVQYWYKIASDWDWGTTTFLGNDRFLANVKFLRFWETGGNLGNFYLQHGYPGLNNLSYFVDENFTTTNNYLNWTMNKTTKDAWHLIQAEFADSSGQNAADGVFRLWIDGQLYMSSSTLVTLDASNTNKKRPLIVGFYNAWSPNTGAGETDDGPNSFYIDDAIIQDDWARVEIGNAATYDNCTHRETQSDFSWTSTQVKFNLNLGTFNFGDSMYLYITDTNGARNAAGMAFSSSDIAPPTISAVTPVTTTAIDVVFSESVEQASAQTTGNYTVTGGITVSAATLDSDLKTVHLAASKYLEDVTYTLMVNNVRDRAAAPNTIVANSQATFNLASTASNTTTTADTAKPENKVVDISKGGKVTFGEQALEVTIHDAGGNVIATLSKSGSNIFWDGRDNSGRGVNAGFYVSKIKKADGSTVYFPVVVVK